LKVKIPCPGHAPLISEELKTIDGVGNVRFSFPNVFDVEYDSSKTTEEEILALEVFETYKATVLESDVVLENNEVQEGLICGSSCGGSCGGCGCGG
jgi:copper chaperone CopZ